MAPKLSSQQTSSGAVRVVPADEAPFADVEAVFGTRGDPATCWCQWYKIPGAEWSSVGVDDLRDRLEAQLAAAGPGPGLLAYDGDEPAGWCAIEPRPALTRLRRSRTVARGTAHPDLDDPGVWSVSCFVVPRAHRGRGVGRALARAAVEFAAAHGARVVEAYAVDPAARARPSAAELFPGTVSMFSDAGFVEARRPSPSRVVMQTNLLALDTY
jgi:ribosomal protein S18 acetylase RimI-like enzyme